MEFYTIGVYGSTEQSFFTIDKKNGISKSARIEIGKVFEIEYKNKILSQFDFDKLIHTLKENNSQKIALFCVEEHPEACHRSIVAKALHLKYNNFIKHL